MSSPPSELNFLRDYQHIFVALSVIGLAYLVLKDSQWIQIGPDDKTTKSGLRRRRGGFCPGAGCPEFKMGGVMSQPGQGQHTYKSGFRGRRGFSSGQMEPPVYWPQGNMALLGKLQGKGFTDDQLAGLALGNSSAAIEKLAMDVNAGNGADYGTDARDAQGYTQSVSGFAGGVNIPDYSGQGTQDWSVPAYALSGMRSGATGGLPRSPYAFVNPQYA